MFFGQYLNKIIVYCPAARTILADNESELISILQRRIDDRLLYNWGGSWSIAYESEVLKKDSKYEQLLYFHKLKADCTDRKISFRIEEPNLTIYGNSEEDLYNIMQNSLFPDRVKEVHKPESAQAKQLLLQGEIITSKHSSYKYNYKIYLRSYRFENIQQKKIISDKLTDIENSVKVPKKLKTFLESDHLFFTGGYFYCTDDSTITFLKLIMPELITSIFKLGHLHS